MGLIYLFHRMQKKKPGKAITLNLHEGGFEIDGKKFVFPAEAAELKKVLGEPRVVESTAGGNIRDRLAADYGLTAETYHPVYLYWDAYGIVGSSVDPEWVHNILIFFGKSQFPMPLTECVFGGTVLFDGQPWQEVITKPGYDGRYRFENSLVHLASYGNKSREKNMKVMEWSLKTEAGEAFKKKIREKNLGKEKGSGEKI